MGNIYTQSILGVNKHKITQDEQRIYTINTRREQTQNNSRWETHTSSIDCVYALFVLSYFVFVQAKY
jgi:hypothetical protein